MVAFVGEAQEEEEEEALDVGAERLSVKWSSASPPLSMISTDCVSSFSEEVPAVMVCAWICALRSEGEVTADGSLMPTGSSEWIRLDIYESK